MVKHTVQKKDLSGTGSKLYVSKDGLIESMSYFLYEVCLYKYWKNGFSQIGSRFFKSNKCLDIKRQSLYKKCDGYLVEKSISMLGAPYEFIKENNLSEYKPVVKTTKRKKKKKMKQFVELIKDSFVDYAGKEHMFIVAAISETLEGHAVVSPDGSAMKWVDNLPKGIRLGVAICNPTDKFDEKVGALKATARARNSEISLYVTNSGLINTTMVRGLLAQEAEYIKNNPEKYIKGYAESKARFLKNEEMKNLGNNLSEIERIIVDKVQEDPKFLDNVNIYLGWLNKQKSKGCRK